MFESMAARGMSPGTLTLLASYDLDDSGYSLLTVPAGPLAGEGADARDFQAGIRSLIDKLPARARLLIGCHRRSLDRVAEWVRERSPAAMLVPLADDLRFSFWSQDACLVAENARSAQKLFLVPKNARRPADAMAMRAIAEAAGFPIQVLKVAVEAGDLLVGDDFVLVGADSYERLTHEEPGASADGRARHPACEISLLAGNREVIAVGSSRVVPQRCVRLHTINERPWIEERFTGTGRRQPIFHLDMFISLAGRGPDGRFRALVGDTRMTASSVPDPAADGTAATIGEQLDEIANDLRRHDRFEVIRNPLPMIYSEEAGLLDWSIHSVEREFGGVEGGDEVLQAMRRHAIRRVGVRRWYFATQNNAVTFRGVDGERSVLLATYAHGRWSGLAAAERRNAQIWTNLGYRVVELADFNVFARRLGSARCLAKHF